MGLIGDWKSIHLFGLPEWIGPQLEWNFLFGKDETELTNADNTPIKNPTFRDRISYLFKADSKIPVVGGLFSATGSVVDTMLSLFSSWWFWILLAVGGVLGLIIFLKIVL